MDNNFEKLVEYFLKFPGIGPRQARRFAFFISGEKESFSKELAELILGAKKETRQCLACFRFFPNNNQEACSICSNQNREKTLMVLEKDMDLENIEKTGAYNGRYFILGGGLALNNENVDKLKFKELYSMIEKEKPTEIILALGATAEGDNASRYLSKIIEPLGVKISKLGRGISTGTELEYIDTDTISNALKNRR